VTQVALERRGEVIGGLSRGLHVVVTTGATLHDPRVVELGWGPTSGRMTQIAAVGRHQVA
jgi:hypothetical protein